MHHMLNIYAIYENGPWLHNLFKFRIDANLPVKYICGKKIRIFYQFFTGKIGIKMFKIINNSYIIYNEN